MKRLRWILIGVLGSIMLLNAGGDREAGYSDGCASARGHYTRSSYKYRHSKAYHAAWRQGKRSCRRIRKPRRHRSRQLRHCDTETAWDAFSRGYDDGFRAAKRGTMLHGRGCAAYHRGWESGYRACACSPEVL